jgi:hypothetical protein
MRRPVSWLSSVFSNGLRKMAYRSILSGHPCLTELLIGKGFDRKPFIHTEDVALSYRFLMGG